MHVDLVTVKITATIDLFVPVILAERAWDATRRGELSLF